MICRMRDSFRIIQLFRRPYFIFLSLVTFTFLVLITRQYFHAPLRDPHDSRLSRRKISFIDYEQTTISEGILPQELLLRIEDLKRIKFSISNEIRLIEHEKAKLLKEKNGLITKIERLLVQINKSKAQLKQLDLDTSASKRTKAQHACDSNKISPIVFKPLKSEDLEQIPDDSTEQIQAAKSNFKQHDTYNLNLSKCPLTKEFKFHLIDSNSLTVNLIEDTLKAHRQHTSIISEACLVVGLRQSNATFDLHDKQNNLIINLEKSEIELDLFSKAVIASSIFDRGTFRDSIDVVLPSIWEDPENYDRVIDSIPPQTPIDRKYLASYFGRGSQDFQPLERVLQIIHRNSIDDLFLFIYDCGPNLDVQCYGEQEKMIELSTFLIILADNQTSDTIDLLQLSLTKGSIPVVVTKEKTRLPFDEVVDWRRAVLILPAARLPEMHFILRSISPNDLYRLKYHGRRILENYLATAKQILDTVISIMSLARFNFPPLPVQEIKSKMHYSEDQMLFDANCTSEACLEAKTDSLTSLLSTEMLGPRERTLTSERYQRNFSLIFNSIYDLWNKPLYSPHYMFPSLPDDPIPPSEYKFSPLEKGYRPIGDGLGGSGYEFSRALGGDYPNEQFTIVLLTYERKSLLIRTLERLKGLAYLNKVLVIWNGINHKPAPDMIWPDVGAPIRLIKVDRNSLNNRFLPFDEIETDAILSLDDDSPLRPDEIVFAFRVWRQSRDRIVGFPGRYHAWDSSKNGWLYNSNHSCELSMVLTGGAFFHKYYAYTYTYFMPSSIRSIVDKFMNCEDIAMNFLVAHLTRKPPIKVTSRWTFHCTNCPSSLSEDESHFLERHECLNIFASIYGYMPLLNTQYRADSVLFKTRLPHDKQKCFKFV